MYTSNPKASVSILMSLLLLACPAAYATAAAGPVQLTSIAEVEVVATDADGNQSIKRVAATEVIPGKDVIYTLNFENVGSDTGNNIVIQNPIPEHTVYKTDPAAGQDTRISFSVDGGEHFAAADLLTITGADGSTRTANASEYTTIRWQYTRPLQPGHKSSVEFRVVLQ